MTWYPDFAPYRFQFQQEPAEVLTIGWLEDGRDYPTGLTDGAVLARLNELVVDPWQLPERAAVHTCDLCNSLASGTATVWIPGRTHVYICPELITHYIVKHGYRPPAEFCEAVLSCPPMESVPYLEAIKAVAPSLEYFAVDSKTLGDRIQFGTAKICDDPVETWASREVMSPYPGVKDRQWVIEYQLGDNSIKIRFHNEFVRVFTVRDSGRAHVDALKRLATAGAGLEEYLRKERPRGVSESLFDPDRPAMMYTARRRL
jgi:hypothetical protein